MTEVIGEAHAEVDQELSDPTLLPDPTRSISGVNAVTILRQAQDSATSAVVRDMSNLETREAELLAAGRTADEVGYIKHVMHA